MEHGKQSSSDASSAENDNKSEKSNEDNTGIGRMYECMFCKRGFTNAQALGGHMNIHRKDKAMVKAKLKNQEESSIQKIESNVNSRYFPQISSVDHQEGNYGYIGAQVNYQAFLPPPNPSYQTENYQSNWPVWRSEHYEDHMDENLNLRIGLSPPVGDGEVGNKDGNAEEDEVDLELRLGHDP